MSTKKKSAPASAAPNVNYFVGSFSLGASLMLLLVVMASWITEDDRPQETGTIAARGHEAGSYDRSESRYSNDGRVKRTCVYFHRGGSDRDCWSVSARFEEDCTIEDGELVCPVFDAANERVGTTWEDLYTYPGVTYNDIETGTTSWISPLQDSVEP